MSDRALYDATRCLFASNLINQNVPIAKISKLLGHSNTKTTAEYYAHIDIQSLKSDLEKLTLKKTIAFPIKKSV